MLRELKTILLATDFRGASRQAAEAAAQLAAASRAHVQLLHVLDVVPTGPLLSQQYKEYAVDRVQELTTQLRSRNVFADALPIGVGSRAEVIVQQADEIAADLIVIGAGELTAGEIFSAGSVAEAVTQHAAQPVLAVRPGADPLRFAVMLCAVDHSDASREALRNSIALAGVLGSALVVLSVVPEPRWFDKAASVPPVEWLTGDDSARTMARAALEHDAPWRAEFGRFLETVAFGNVPWNREIRQGDASAEIIAAAERHRADLIVMGVTGRGRIRRLLMGSTTRRVLKRLPCSLLTVRGADGNSSPDARQPAAASG